MRLVARRLHGERISRTAAAAARELLADAPKESPVGAVLRRLVRCSELDTVRAEQDLAPAVLDYGRELEYAAKWELALDVYTLLARTPVASHTSVDASLRIGVCLRQLDRLREAEHAYAEARRLARRLKYHQAALRARFGAANVVIALGNFPHAKRLLERLVVDCRREGAREVMAMALGSLAVLHLSTDDKSRGIALSLAAMKETRDQVQRDRLLNNIGEALRELGHLSQARDALLIVAHTGREQFIRWSALMSLMNLAADSGDVREFRAYRDQLKRARLTPKLEVDFLIHLGKSYRALGQPAASRSAFARAVKVAERASLNALLFDAERAWAEAEPATSPPEPALPPSLAEVATTLRSMRLAATQGR
ncbi:MAG TPA: tetratricopeptide repeat protein [Gemmatimonadaceae bacterium]|nr:tetratricopeptide repeat protein [Gemmatimonadaceae bacterium]